MTITQFLPTMNVCVGVCQPPVQGDCYTHSFLLQHGYRVTRELGRGAFGCVYEAVPATPVITPTTTIPCTQQQLPPPPPPPQPLPAGVTECAIKKVSFMRMGHVSARGHSTCTDELRIAQALVACPAPHVVRVYRTLVDSTEGAYYIVMERLRGNTLRDLVVRHREYRGGLKDEYQLKNCVGSIVMGVLELERRGIVHRDIKPENVFVSDRGTWTEVKLIDFGLGRFVEGGANELMRSVVGSPLYMTPELEQGGAYRWDCDLWGAGMCAYFVGTGRELVAVDTATYVEAKRAVWEQCTEKGYHFAGIKGGSGAERVLKKLLGKKRCVSGSSVDNSISRCEEVLADKWFSDCNLARDSYCPPPKNATTMTATPATTTLMLPITMPQTTPGTTTTYFYQQQQPQQPQPQQIIIPTTGVPTTVMGGTVVYPQQQQQIYCPYPSYVMPTCPQMQYSCFCPQPVQYFSGQQFQPLPPPPPPSYIVF